MSETLTVDPAVPAPAAEDKVLPGIVYALYLVGLTNGITAIIGLIIAYASRDRAGPKTASHYTFLIRTFWLTLGLAAAGVLLLAIGFPFSFILVGLPVLALGFLVLKAAWLYFLIRCVVGGVYLLRGDAHPRPRALLV